MSIPGVSAISSAAYFQQLQNIGQTNSAGQVATAQTPVSTLAAPGAQTGAIQAPDQVRHHHHGGGGDAGTPSGPAQSGTTNTAGGTGLLNTLV